MRVELDAYEVSLIVDALGIAYDAHYYKAIRDDPTSAPDFTELSIIDGLKAKMEKLNG